ncbi:MAG TPA: hypothetical protein VG710_07815 [Opitutus sp.]|nr:hypothetical protein [Opitutus sp.]
MDIDSQTLLRFLEPQIRDYGANIEIGDGLWAIFAVEAGDEITNAFARTLLREARFAHDSGLSADDRWTLYYVDTAHRAEAIHWLEDLRRIAAGEIRSASPAQRGLIAELIASPKPHRVAQELAGLIADGQISAGIMREPAVVRGCLDRLHQREPLFFAAFHALLSHHLIDMVVLLQRLIREDVELNNELVRGALSRDPFQQSLQDSAVGIRGLLTQFHVINPLDQQKNHAIENPYAVYLDLARAGDHLSLALDGISVTVPRENFVRALRSVRHRLYRGERFASFDTQSPWMHEAIAHGFRFIKQRLDRHRELPPLSALYMLERAVES